jgi:catalase
VTDALAQAAIAAIDRSFGEHEGRAVHIKGGWAQGTFTATPEGTSLCRDAMAREPDYLATELRERLAAGPAAFTLLARIAQDGDPLDDPTAGWPEDREAMAVGRLVLERAVDSPETPNDIHVFDPLRICDGIEASDDPILHFRRRAYDVSARRRWAGS